MKDRCKDELSIVNCQLSISEFLRKDEQKDLLRLLTAGSVDDGKSTLIGRLLFDSKKLYEDQLDALERDSKRMGNAGDHIDYALLLDGLKAEREQGITIDVAYRYFSTNNRKFIIADTPGHEQYTRNMITGALRLTWQLFWWMHVWVSLRRRAGILFWCRCLASSMWCLLSIRWTWWIFPKNVLMR